MRTYAVRIVIYFAGYINSQKKDTQGVPLLKKRNGSGIAQSEFEKVEEFNGQFSDVFTKSEYRLNLDSASARII